MKLHLNAEEVKQAIVEYIDKRTGDKVTRAQFEFTTQVCGEYDCATTEFTGASADLHDV